MILMTKGYSDESLPLMSMKTSHLRMSVASAVFLGIFIYAYYSTPNPDTEWVWIIGVMFCLVYWLCNLSVVHIRVYTSYLYIKYPWRLWGRDKKLKIKDIKRVKMGIGARTQYIHVEYNQGSGIKIQRNGISAVSFQDFNKLANYLDTLGIEVETYGF